MHRHSYSRTHTHSHTARGDWLCLASMVKWPILTFCTGSSLWLFRFCSFSKDVDVKRTRNREREREEKRERGFT